MAKAPRGTEVSADRTAAVPGRDRRLCGGRRIEASIPLLVLKVDRHATMPIASEALPLFKMGKGFTPGTEELEPSFATRHHAVDLIHRGKKPSRQDNRLRQQTPMEDVV